MIGSVQWSAGKLGALSVKFVSRRLFRECGIGATNDYVTVCENIKAAGQHGELWDWGGNFDAGQGTTVLL